jgi:ABC-type branched-subunit amino acid transport system substrate-binding protein
VANSPVFFLGSKYAQEAGIPVTGNSGDGSEWGTQPNTNMFPADNNNTNPAVPWSKLLGNFLKSRGGTNLATYGYSISPSSVHATYGSASSALAAGLKVGIMDTTVQFGTESFGTEALAAKSAKIDSLSSQMDINSNLALLNDMKQNGLNPKVVSFDTGYQPSLIKSNVWNSVQGVYFGTDFRPWNIPANAGTTVMQQTMTKYAHFKAGQFPDYAQYESYLGAELMFKGLLKAGANPTPASTIKALRSITAWNGDGILPTTVNFTNNFGYNSKVGCEWNEQAKPNSFVPVSATPMCAPYIPGSTSFNPPKI